MNSNNNKKETKISKSPVKTIKITEKQKKKSQNKRNDSNCRHNSGVFEQTPRFYNTKPNNVKVYHHFEYPSAEGLACIICHNDAHLIFRYTDNNRETDQNYCINCIPSMLAFSEEVIETEKRMSVHIKTYPTIQIFKKLESFKGDRFWEPEY